MKKLIISFVVYLSTVHICMAFDDRDTHPSITDAAIMSIKNNLDGTLKNNLGINDGLVQTFKNSSSGETYSGQTFSVTEWLKKGSTAEDSPVCRASNHFHDPTKSWTLSEVTDQPAFISAWCGLTGYSTKYSNVTWATAYCGPVDLNCRVVNIGNDMDWAAARNYYLQALTSIGESERETNFAKTFQAVGQVLHLLEDMAVPAHTRNDFTSHLVFQGIQDRQPDQSFIDWLASWFGNSFEYYVKNNPGLVSTSSNIPAFTKVTDYWDSDGSGEGLAEFTNANYFSAETIPSNNPSPEHGFSSPQINNSTHQICEDYEPGGTTMRKYISRGSGNPCPQAGSVDHFATPSLLNEESLMINDKVSSLKLWLDDNVHDTYAKELLPKAVGYSAGLLNYFFRGDMTMWRDKEGSDQYVIRNNSSETMTGTFSLYYDNDKDMRQQTTSWGLTISPNSESTVHFQAPRDSKEKGKYILVFNGTLGNETGAIAGKTLELCEATTNKEITISGPDELTSEAKYTAEGGTEPYTWSIDKGSISEDGTVSISGQCGTATVTVTDACGKKKEKSVTLITEISGSDAPVSGDQYTATGGMPPYTWSFDKGSISQDGVITFTGECGTGIITLADSCGTAVTKNVELGEGIWVYQGYTDSGCSLKYYSSNGSGFSRVFGRPDENTVHEYLREWGQPIFGYYGRDACLEGGELPEECRFPVDEVYSSFNDAEQEINSFEPSYCGPYNSVWFSAQVRRIKIWKYTCVQ